MIKRKSILLLFGLILIAIGQAQVSKTINVTIPGTLSTLLTSTELTTITDLIVTGNIDARDFKTMKYSLIKLAKLDLSAVSISYYVGREGPEEYFYTDTTSVTEYPANEIPSYAFHLFSWTSIGKESLESIVLPNSITSIGYRAFAGCTGMNNSLVIPSTVTEIGESAFNGCSGLIGSLIIPSSVRSIGGLAFYNCSGFNGILTLPDSIEIIGEKAFMKCSNFIGSLTIPSSLSVIKYGAFSNCSSFNGNLIISDSIKIIESNAFKGCSGFTGSLIIPALVETIGRYAFQDCTGFNGNLILSDSIKIIEDYVFKGCSGFKGSLTIPSSVTKIGNYAFYGCSGFNGSLSLPSSLRGIHNDAFSGCSGFTGSLVIPASVTIMSGAFYGCSGFNGTLTILSTSSIPTNAFYGCSGFTGSLVIRSVLVDDYAFYGCSGFNGTLTLRSVMMDIGDYAFYGCSGFTGSLNIPDFGSGNSGIGEYAFYGCSGFDGNLILSSSITRIGNYAFYGCSGFTGPLDMPKNSNIYFENVYNIYSIGAYAFAGCKGFNGALNLPDEKILQIGNYAFADCSGLVDSLTIPLGVVTIGDYAFSNCSGLNGSLTFSSSVKSIGVGSFMNCSGLDNTLSISTSITFIGKNAFSNCSNLKRINAYGTDPSKVELGSDVFSGIPKSTCGLSVPISTKPKYAIAAQWKEFFYLSEGVPATVTTGIINNIFSTNPTGNGNITNFDPNDPTQFGIVWSISPNPTIELPSRTEQGLATGIGPFAYSLSGLNANTNYFVKAYTTNSTGTCYGNQISFRTPNPVMSSPSTSSLSGFVTTKGAPSAIQTFTISGTNLVSNIVVTAPSGFEIRQYGYGNFASSISLTHVSGLIPDRTIEVRMASTLTSDIISGNIVCSTAWTADQIVIVDGVVSRKQLTITNPTVVTNKMVDGNTSAVLSKLGTLQGVDAADAANVSVTATATYDNPNVGANKTITVVYALSGGAKDKYIAPENYVISNVKISDYITLRTLFDPTPGCEGSDISLTYTLLTGTPTKYKITFDSSALNAGMNNIAYQDMTNSNVDGEIILSVPNNTKDGTFQGVLMMKNELDVESVDYPFTFTVNVSSDNIITKFDDVILFNNSDKRFVDYQWYINDIEIPGATKQFYYSPIGLIGDYSLRLTTSDGETLYTCKKSLNIFAIKTQVAALPNPVKENGDCTVYLTGFNEEQLKSAIISIYNMQGGCVYKEKNVHAVNKVSLPISGAYVGHVTATGMGYSFKLIVVE